MLIGTIHTHATIHRHEGWLWRMFIAPQERLVASNIRTRKSGSVGASYNA